jgi:hypothetical protein
MKLFLYIYIVLISVNLVAQEDSLVNKDTINKEYFLIKGDTLYNNAIDLDEVVVLKKMKFSTNKDRIKYLILRRKVRKVYPYAKLASEKLTDLNDSLQHIRGKRKQKKYTKRIQKYIEEEFSVKLKKLTRTEGQILIKLIHRQTGVTAFELIRELRSGWRAFWYNSTASLFNISLKEEYNPINVTEDYYIEDILMRSFSDQILEKQVHKLDFNYFELSDKWISD